MSWLLRLFLLTSLNCLFVRGNKVVAFGKTINTEIDFDNRVFARFLRLNDGALGIVRKDGLLITLGSEEYGSTRELQYSVDVNHFEANTQAMAAVKFNGSVVAWPKNQPWMDYERTYPENTVQIFHNDWSFVAIGEDGSIVAFGDNNYGGDSSSLSDKRVKFGCPGFTSEQACCRSNYGAHACILSDGSAVSWGHHSYGGDSRTVAEALSEGVLEIYSAQGGSFAAVVGRSRSLVVWGKDSHYATSVPPESLTDVQKVGSTFKAWAVINSIGKATTFGPAHYGGDSSTVEMIMRQGCEKIFSNPFAFAIVKRDYSLVAFGASEYGGSVGDQEVKNVREVVGNHFAFAAITRDRKILAWGDPRYGGDTSTVADRVSRNIDRLFSNKYSFLAIEKSNVRITTWGDPERGGNSSSVFLGGRARTVLSSDSNYAIVVETR